MNRIPSSLAAILASLLAASAHAVETRITSELRLAGQQDTNRVVISDTGRRITDQDARLADFGQARFEAQASPGQLGLTAIALATLPSFTAATVESSWSDAFTITAPGYGPTDTGTFTALARVSSGALALLGVNDGWATGRMTGGIGFNPHTGYSSGIVSAFLGSRWDMGSGIGSGITGEQNFTLRVSVNFTFGRDIDMRMVLNGQADAHSFGRGSISGGYLAQVLYPDAMQWAGFESIHDAHGKALDHYTALSATSGFDFSRPVPEPQSGQALVLGLGLLAVVVARRRRTV